MTSGKRTTGTWLAVRFTGKALLIIICLAPKVSRLRMSDNISLSELSDGRTKMLQVSRKILDYFDRRLEGAAISEPERSDYRKWVRFYLDFCDKYGHAPRSGSSLRPFLAKLASKNQSTAQQQQASRAVKLLTAADG
ncbi:MAG TPA: hypothetical protein VIT23_05370, partial [Terrimicrobiaceae bacterium]